MSAAYFQILRKGTSDLPRLKTPFYYSALSRVPDCIWYDIFAFVVDPAQPRAIYRYATICFYFYHLLRRFPKLWTNVHFYLDLPPVKNPDIQTKPTEQEMIDTEIRLLRTFAWSCRTVPWSLTVTVKDPSRPLTGRSRNIWDPELKQITAICKCLPSLDLSKLTSLRLDLPCLFLLHMMMDRLKLEPLPKLNTLEIIHNYPQQIAGRAQWKNNPNFQFGLNPVPHCRIKGPALHRLKINLLCIPRGPCTGLSSLFSLHITGLRDEQLNRVPASELVNVLQNLPKLAILDLEGEHDRTARVGEQPLPLNERIQLPSLSHLRISRVHPLYLIKIFCYCDAVKLKWIELQGFSDHDAHDIAYLFSLFNCKRFPSLIRLYLLEVCGEVFQRILPEIPWCQELALLSTLTHCRHCYTVPAITVPPTVNLWEPVADDPSKWYCPKLQKLLIGGRNPPWFHLASQEIQSLVLRRYQSAEEGNGRALEWFHYHEYGNEQKELTSLELLMIALVVPVFKIKVHGRPKVANASEASAAVGINPRLLLPHP
ncbi:hypothetical protein NLI96_g7258 [Meripilus lineatus]|uniref:F-box domain-containing protein n=1 Tax=Meripilus lineatus TaxID=2056292 RepID=A0AAD5V4R1_9APHY|nr:hypothetical protein NLI96_g7258 [Physisporinus lineatus]